MAYSDESENWGIYARSFFWFVQSSVLSGVALVALGMRNGGAVSLAIAVVASFLSVVLLFRQINALVDQKLERRE